MERETEGVCLDIVVTMQTALECFPYTRIPDWRNNHSPLKRNCRKPTEDRCKPSGSTSLKLVDGCLPEDTSTVHDPTML